jgi:hypothetical protein
MDTPAPVDVNKLKSILSASKTIMKKVETNDYQTGNIDARALTEEGVAELQAEGISRPAPQYVESYNPAGYTQETVKNSRLPEAIKKIMIEKPIPKLSNPNHTFSLDDVTDLQEKPMRLPKTPSKSAPKRIVTESYASPDMITISKDELKEMVNDIVNEKLLEFFIQNHNKRITEETVKKTVTLLTKEGKLKKTI